MRVQIAAVQVLPDRRRARVVSGGRSRIVALDRVRPYLPDGAMTDDLNRLIAVEERHTRELLTLTKEYR